MLVKNVRIRKLQFTRNFPIVIGGRTAICFSVLCLHTRIKYRLISLRRTKANVRVVLIRADQFPFYLANIDLVWHQLHVALIIRFLEHIIAFQIFLL